MWKGKQNLIQLIITIYYYEFVLYNTLFIIIIYLLLSNIFCSLLVAKKKKLIINMYKMKMIEGANLPVDQKLKYYDIIKFISHYTGI